MTSLALVAALLLGTSSPGRPVLLNFPGQAKPARSPTSEMRVYSVGRRPGIIRLMLDRGRGRRTQLLEIERNVDVAWAPDGKRFFVDDIWGSDAADCLVMRPTAGGIANVNLSQVLQALPWHPTGREARERSHYYVDCEAWASDRAIRGRVHGHTDEVGGGHDFDYPFVYDAGSGKATWRKRGNTR